MSISPSIAEHPTIDAISLPPGSPLPSDDLDEDYEQQSTSDDSDSETDAKPRTRSRKATRSGKRKADRQPTPRKVPRKQAPRKNIAKPVKAKKRTRGIQLVWKDSTRKEKRNVNFTGSPGIKRQPEDSSDPLSIFKLFFSDKIVDEIVRCTNIYAETIVNSPRIIERINKNKTKKGLYSTWKATDRDEIWIYMTILLLMGITRKPELDMYWSNDSVLETPIFRRLMPRNRFHSIRIMIHYSDILEYDSADPLHKLSYLIEELSDNFEKTYVPEQNIAIDEYLSLWKGRLSFRVYIPSKRERYGIKLFMLCESSSGYLSKFIIYSGAATDYGDCSGIDLPQDHVRSLTTVFEDLKSPTKVVLSLMRPFFNKGYHLTLDNYYTSPELAIVLDTLNTPCYGTMRKKEGLPEDFWTWKPKKGAPPKMQMH
ncbi:MAG: hypothetical protein AAF391_14145, partial [Bacteroidota bacterium]